MLARSRHKLSRNCASSVPTAEVKERATSWADGGWNARLEGMPNSVVRFGSIVNRSIAAVSARVDRWLLFWLGVDPTLQASMGVMIALGRALEALYTPFG